MFSEFMRRLGKLKKRDLDVGSCDPGSVGGQGHSAQFPVYGGGGMAVGYGGFGYGYPMIGYGYGMGGYGYGLGGYGMGGYGMGGYGMGYGLGYGMGYGMGGYGMGGYGFGYPGVGYGYGYGYPGFYGGGYMPPMYGIGLTPLGAQSYMIDTQLFGRRSCQALQRLRARDTRRKSKVPQQ